MPQGDKPGAPQEILERPGNRECADCKAFKPSWASWNLGILICETCSGIHRNLGVHITKVKSTKLDKWKQDQVGPCKNIGNEISNAYYEHSVPEGKRYLANVKSSGGDKIDPLEARKLERWIRDKYEKKKYAPPGIDPPHVRLERGEKLDGAQQRSSSKAAPADDAKLDIKSHPEEEKSAEKKRHRSRSSKNKKTSKENGEISLEPEATSHFAGAEKAFATLGEWAADASPDDNKSKKDKHEKKEKKDKKKHKHHSSSASPVRGQGYSFAEGSEGFGCSPDHLSPGHQLDQNLPYEFQSGQQYPSHLQQSQQYPPYGDQNIQQHGQQLPFYSEQQQQHPPDHQQAPQQFTPYHDQDQQILHQPHDPRRPQTPQLYQDQQCQQPGSYQQSHHGQSDHQAVGNDQYAGIQFEQQTKQFYNQNTQQEHDANFDQNQAERRAALQSVASLLGNPQSFVPQGAHLLPLFGFDLQSAVFQPTALRKSKEPKSGKGLERGSAAGQVDYTFAGLGSFAPDTSATFGSSAPVGQQDDFAGFESCAPTGQNDLFAAKQDEFVGAGYFAPNGQLDAFGGTTLGFSDRHATPPLPEASPAAPWSQEMQNGKHSSSLSDLAPIKAAVTGEISQLQVELRHLREEMSSLHKATIKEVREVQDLTKKHQEDDDWWNLPSGPTKLDLASVSSSAQQQDAIHHQQKEQIQMQQQQISEQQMQIQQILQLLQQQQHLLSRPDHLAPQSSAITQGSCTPAPISPPPLQGSVGLPSPLPAGHCSGLHSEHFTWAHGSSPDMVGPAQACCSPDAISCSPSYAPTITDDGSRFSPAHCATSLWQVSAPTWELDAGTFTRYLQLFTQIDQNHDGFVEAAEARPLFDSSQLHVKDLYHCWELASSNGRLSLAEFCCAYQLVEARRQGFELPLSMPLELMQSASQHVAAEMSQQHPAAAVPQIHDAPAGPPQSNAATEPLHAAAPQDQVLPSQAEPTPWLVTQEELDAILWIFLATQRQEPEFLSSAEARGVLEKSQLSHQDLHEIWRLSDVDCDGRLGFGEFACAMHLTSRRREGEILPASLPGELLSLAGKSLPADQEERTDSAMWEVTPEHLQQYASIFAGLDRKDDGQLLGAAETKDVLEQSGLPQEEILHICKLSDVDGDGMLSLGEFACAMHLVAGRRLGSRLPKELPLQLSQLVAGAMDTQAGLRALESSPWAISNDQLEQYRQLFQSLDKQDPAVLSATEAKAILSRSQLPRQQLSHIWTLSDVDRDSQLCFPEFACAIHLASLCRQGVELPGDLPQELTACLAATNVFQ